MFKLHEKHEIIRRILKCDYIRHSPSEINTINNANFQIYINIPKDDSVVSLLIKYNSLNFDVVHAATGNRYADSNDTRVTNLARIISFSKYKLSSNSGKHLKDISHAHTVSPVYKPITSTTDTDDLSIGFDRDLDRRQRELTHYKIKKSKFHLTIYSKDIFGFAERQKKTTMV